MPPKPVVTGQPEPALKKSILVIPSRVVSHPEEINIEDGEITEIAAQITVPHEGGWGWVVVFAAFWCIFILDGVAFTFGSVFSDITQDTGFAESAVAFISSIAIALYFIAAPFASAFINRFGFRACVMSGSIICSFSLLCANFSYNYGALCLFYGAFAGLGYCFINMASSLVVGFYFEKLRALALALATNGSSMGIMIMFPFNSYIVNLAGWRTLTLLHSGLFGLIFYLGMTYRPLLSLTVAKTTDDPTRTVTYLPSLSAVSSRAKANKEAITSTATERLFSAVSNANYPTAAAVIDDGLINANEAGPSTAVVSKLKITAQAPRSGMSHRQLQQVKSIISKASLYDNKTQIDVEITPTPCAPKKPGCCARLCHWEMHVPQARPMYRDDAFYDGKLKNLPVYQKSMMDASAEPKTGLEYQLAVSRAITTEDLRERQGVFTTAARRVLATMMDPKLLKRHSFQLLCTSGFFTYLGYLVPYVFLQSRNLSYGIDPKHCSFLVSVIGFSNAVGRLLLGALACKADPHKLFLTSCICSGTATLLSSMSYSIYYQYAYCCVFGFFIASIASLRSMVLVELYGLDKLTNATGMMLMFQGLGSLFCTPLASFLKTHFGYGPPFTVAGACLVLSGTLLIPVKWMAAKE